MNMKKDHRVAVGVVSVSRGMGMAVAQETTAATQGARSLPRVC